MKSLKIGNAACGLNKIEANRKHIVCQTDICFANFLRLKMSPKKLRMRMKVETNKIVEDENENR